MSTTYGLYGNKKTTRIGKPQTPAQRRAAKENYALFQLAGARGNLTVVKHSLKNLAVHSEADANLYYALKYINQTMVAIKHVQRIRRVQKP